MVCHGVPNLKMVVFHHPYRPHLFKGEREASNLPRWLIGYCRGLIIYYLVIVGDYDKPHYLDVYSDYIYIFIFTQIIGYDWFPVGSLLVRILAVPSPE